MFTGIIQSVGHVTRIEARGGDVRLHVDTASLDLADLATGDSIAVSGVCLTAVDLFARSFTADVSGETLSCTTFRMLREGDPVNLERALRLGDSLGGHLVAGHVDGVAKVLDMYQDARSQRWRFLSPDSLTRYIARKGSISVDGVSLTVNEVDGSIFSVNLVPHTIASTTFSRRTPGDEVNIEVDLLARYVERMLAGRFD